MEKSFLLPPNPHPLQKTSEKRDKKEYYLLSPTGLFCLVIDKLDSLYSIIRKETT